MIKQLYKFICRHSTGAIRVLILASIAAVVIGETISEAACDAILLVCLAISFTMQIGSSCKWER